MVGTAVGELRRCREEAGRARCVRAAATEICCPTSARTRISVASTAPGTRIPGTARTDAASAASAARAASTAVGSASRSNRRRTRAIAAGRSATDVSSSSTWKRAVPRALPGGGPYVARNAPGPCGSASVRAYDRTGPVRSATSTPSTARAARNANTPRASNGSRRGSVRSSTAVVPPSSPTAPGSSGTRPPTPREVTGRSGRARRRSSLGVVSKTSVIVSLNCRTLPKPAANATSARRRSVPVSRARAVWARSARASATGPAPSSATSTRCTCRAEYPR
ncbi:hypothetical protein M768_02425 [Cellulosimicrobium cellulans F16]|uniref:Uncharacterized protein n=1 Tax=Cellulosimicrobium cellulans F16 TaxID=1350482 RepID=A0A0M0FB24_CELCE|nr:hypothetical protein M768_02425 [Cellulosimicrobium cellulans F16]